MTTAVVHLKGQHADTIARRLTEHHKYAHVTFAAAVRATVLNLNPFVDVNLDDGGRRLSTFVAGDGDTLNWVRRNIPEADRFMTATRTTGAHLDTMKEHIADAFLYNTNVVVISDTETPREAALLDALDALTFDRLTGSTGDTTTIADTVRAHLAGHR